MLNDGLGVVSFDRREEWFLIAGPVLRGDPTSGAGSELPEDSGRSVMRGSGSRQERVIVKWNSVGWRFLRRRGEWAQVAERLMAADCKSAAPWSYGGSNPPLCTSCFKTYGALDSRGVLNVGYFEVY
jgi:hypothetical protein